MSTYLTIPIKSLLLAPLAHNLTNQHGTVANVTGPTYIRQDCRRSQGSARPGLLPQLKNLAFATKHQPFSRALIDFNMSSYPLRIETSPPPPPRRYSTFTAAAYRDITPTYYDDYRDEARYSRGRRSGRRSGRQRSPGYTPASPRFSPTSPQYRTPSAWTSSEDEGERYRAAKPARLRHKRSVDPRPVFFDQYSDDLGIIHDSRTQPPLVIHNRPHKAVTLYSFAPSRLVASTKSSESDFIEHDKQETSVVGTGRGLAGAPACHVLASGYDGEGYLGGRHTVQLTTLMSREVLSNSLFRWM